MVLVITDGGVTLTNEFSHLWNVGGGWGRQHIAPASTNNAINVARCGGDLRIVSFIALSLQVLIAGSGPASLQVAEAPISWNLLISRCTGQYLTTGREGLAKKYPAVAEAWKFLHRRLHMPQIQLLL